MCFWITSRDYLRGERMRIGFMVIGMEAIVVFKIQGKEREYLGKICVHDTRFTFKDCATKFH